MKVVHIINRLIGGGAEVMVPLIHKEHLKSGVDSWVLSMETEDDRGTPQVVSFGERLPRWKEPFRLRTVLRGIEKDGPIDVVHTHLTQSQLFAKYAIRGLSKRPLLITTEHDTSNRRRELSWGRTFDRVLYQGYDRVVCISDGVKRSMEVWLPGLSGRLVTAANGVDLTPLQGLTRTKSANGEIRFLSVGRVIPKKNFEVAIRALAALGTPNWTYTIVGEGEQRSELEALSKTLGVADRVRFAGYVDDVVPFYATSDVFLLPSLWEGFGLVAVEAMGAGLPVFAADVAGLSEVVGRDGEAGVLIPPTDVELWVNVLRTVTGDPGEIARMSAVARERAKAYSIDQTAENYLRIYREML
ncbi:MAG: glycosyltransferase family 4 protein [Puniceicoccales bacterium]